MNIDHADIFADLAAIETQFHHLVRTVPGEGLIARQRHEAALRETLDKGCWTPVEFFGNHDGWQVANVQADGAFDVRLHGEKVGHVAWALMGEHNRLNALAAIAAARHAGVSIGAGM